MTGNPYWISHQTAQLREQLRIHRMSAQILCCTADGRGPSEDDLKQHCGPKDVASVAQAAVQLTSATLDPEQVPLMKMPAEGTPPLSPFLMGDLNA